MRVDSVLHIGLTIYISGKVIADKGGESDFYLEGDSSESASTEMICISDSALRVYKHTLIKEDEYEHYLKCLDTINSVKPAIYNETGFFAINYVVDVVFENMDSNAEIDSTTDSLIAYSKESTKSYGNNSEFVSSLRDENGNIVYEKDGVEIDKLDEYVIVTYEDGELVPVHTYFGEQLTESGRMDVLYNSDFSYYK